MSNRDQFNVYFGQSNPERYALEVAKRLKEQGIDVGGLIKKMFTQIGKGEITYDPDTLEISTGTLEKKIDELHNLIKAGKINLVTSADAPVEDGKTNVVVSKAAYGAWASVDD